MYNALLGIEELATRRPLFLFACNYQKMKSMGGPNFLFSFFLFLVKIFLFLSLVHFAFGLFLLCNFLLPKIQPRGWSLERITSISPAFKQYPNYIFHPRRPELQFLGGKAYQHVEQVHSLYAPKRVVPTCSEGLQIH